MISKHLGLLAIMILVYGLALVIWRWPQGKHMTFSQHVAVSKYLIIYYSLLFWLTLPLLLVFFYGWFMPMFRLPVWFGGFVAAGSALQLACTMVPEVGGRKTAWHRALAGLSALCLVPALLVLAATATVPVAGRFVAVGGLAIMLTIIVLIIKGKGEHGHFLILQSSYFAAFFVPILVATYATGL